MVPVRIGVGESERVSLSRASLSSSLPGGTLRWVAALGFAIGLLVAVPAAASADPGDVGFVGPAGPGGAPSGSKPESKLWFNDGFWWATLYDTGTGDVYIWKLNQATETWSRTNTRLDDRSSTRDDVLWDGTKLYVASHNFSENDGNGTSRLYRLSYDSSTDTYTVDSGFPQTINSVRSETLVIAKDSTGKLWATWEQGGSIYVNRTTSGDSTWGTPFVLPGAAAVNGDDISSIIAYGGNKIGIFWSNQNATPDADFFAVHTDGTADTTGWAIETAYTGTNLADDHMNLKTDAAGKVYAVVKTSLDNAGTSPLIVLLDRATDGTWSNHPVSQSSFDQTRAILEIDQTNNLLRVFATSGGSGGTINEHDSPIGAISFDGGAGTVVIKDASALKMNNATSTKQNISSATGLIVVAFNDTTKRYWHADILNTPPPNTAPTANAASATTPSGQAVGVNLSGRDAETCELTFSVVSGPSHGTLGSITPATCASGSPNTDTASVTYTPTASYVGPDSFTYKVNDGSLDSTTATASLTVTGTDNVPPTRTTSTVNGSTLVVTYDEPLDTGSVPATSAFAPLVNGSARGVSNVAISGSAVTLTLASPVTSSDTVTLSYTAPGTSPVQDVAGNDAASFSTVAVTNNTPPPGGGTSTFTPTADAHVKSTSPTANYGTLTTMQLREEAAGVTYRDYLKFNVTGLSGTVSAVKLRLFITDVSPDSGTVYRVSDTSWGETSIIWNNAPTLGSSVGSAGATTTAGTWVEITLDPSAVSGNGLVSFGIKTTSTNSSIFSSKEGTNPPQLLVTTGGPPSDVTPPVLQSAHINGSALTLTYNEALDGSSDPSNSDLTLSVNGSPVALSSINASGTTVTATAASPVVSTDAVTASYTPGSSPIQDVAGNDAASFSGTSVTNDTPAADTTPPVFQSATINGTAVSMTYDEALNAGSTPANGDITLKVNGTTDVSVTNVSVSGTHVTGTAASAVTSADSVTLCYTPGSSPIEDVAHNDASQLTAVSVTNNTPASDITPPSKTGQTVNGASLVITYDEALDTASVPAASAYDVQVGGSARSVSNVAIAGSSVTLTLATPVTSANSVTIAYTKPATNPVQDGAGNDAASFSAASVTNDTPPANTAPTAAATSATTPFGQAVSVGLSGSDPETCQLTFSIVSGPAHGSLGSISNAACVAGSPNTDTASVTYTPTSGYSGPDSFTYKVNDGTTDSSAATASLTVSAASGGTLTFTPTDDAQVKSTSPTANYGALTSMQLREEPSGGTLPTYRDYLKFTVTGLSGTVTAVKLRLFVTDVSTDSGSVFAVADTSWTEAAITWNTAPALGTTALGAAGTTTTAGAYVDITLTPSSISGNGTFSFAVKTTSTNSSIFDSSEGANPPQLVVTTS